MIIDSPIISGSLSASGSLNQFGSVTITGSLTVTGDITGNITGSATNAISASFAANANSASFAANANSASFAATASFALNVPQTASFAISASNAATASYLSNYIPPFPFTGSAGISGSLVVNGNITAQTLVVQTITSSQDFVTGSTKFGSIISNTHQFTGSVTVSGSLAVNDSNVIVSSQTSSMSVATASYWSGSILNATSASFASTASYWSGSINNALSASFADTSTSASFATTASFSLNVPVTASFANTATSASFATTASFSLNVPVTASYANNANSASYALTSSFSLNVPVTASFANNATSASYANNATSASFATTASYLTGYISPFPYTGSAIISGSLVVTGSVAASNLQGVGVRYLVTDASGSVTAQTASAAIKQTQAFTSSANQTSFTIDNGYTTGLVDVFINGSKLAPGVEFTDTSGTVITLATGSNSGDLVEFVKYFPALGVTNNALRQQTTFTASAGQTVFSASYTPGLLDIFYNGSRLSNNEYTANNGTFFTLATGSVAGDILDVFVYSYQVGAFSGIGGTGVVNQLAFFNTTSSISGSSALTVSGNTLVGTASYASNADTLDGSHLSILATTGSNTFTSAQYISNTSAPIGFTDTASLYTDGGLRATRTSYFSSSVYVGGDLIIFGTQSVNYITSSQLNIADNIITVNTSTPALRFGGIAVQDSGSLATGLTGSLLWDSQDNQWLYSNPSGSTYDSALLLVGPRNSGSLGSEVGITVNALAKGDGAHHMTSSGIFENGTLTSIYSTMYVSSSGNVGIGVIPTQPSSLVFADTLSSKILLNNNVNNYRIDLTSSISGGDAMMKFIAGSTTAGEFSFYTTTNLRMIITSGGNVGIGTTSPNQKLEVWGTTRNYAGVGYYSDFAYNGTTYNFANTEATDNVDFKIAGGGTFTTGGNFRFWTQPGNTTPVERMRITTGGQLLLGTQVTTSGISSFDLLTLGKSGSSSTAMLFSNGSSSIWGFIYNSASKIVLGSSSDLAFETGGSYNERLRITSSGTVQPGANGTQDLGTSSLRWGTVYTSDLDMSNGIGDYTIVEGEEDLFLYNNKTNKVFKFIIQEVDPSIATPKMKKLCL